MAATCPSTGEPSSSSVDEAGGLVNRMGPL